MEFKDLAKSQEMILHHEIIEKWCHKFSRKWIRINWLHQESLVGISPIDYSDWKNMPPFSPC